MMPIKEMNIAVVGDEELVSGMRLAGVSRYHVVSGGDNTGEDVRQVLDSLVNDPEVGVIVMVEDYMPYAESIIKKLREEKRLTPVIIEVPSKYGTKHEDVTAYYRSFIRRFVGFDIQI
jgi:vacuolar-type H+-ATPase subunit F/Vma7